jgi:SAM-dependent methyltransferase
MKSAHAAELRAGSRFEFGENWARFLGHLTDERLRMARQSLQSMLDTSDLTGKRFIDVGSGSGLFSLCAHQLGASVHSIDYDPRSVACTAELKRRYAPAATNWTIEEGSALDTQSLRNLGTYDIVYSWGVLHHTGNMHLALDNMTQLVAPGGLLFVAIYNDQGWKSRYWSVVKRLYNKSRPGRFAMTCVHAPFLYFGRAAKRVFTGDMNAERGMSLWYDFIDWIGGYPFEVASTAAVQEFYEQRGLRMIRVHDVGVRMGCNELLFVKPR